MASTADLPRRLARLPVTPGFPGTRFAAGMSGAAGMPGAGGEARGGGMVGRASLTLFLALYLLLLAFFIMLTALSSLERQRAEAVMDSLTLTFAPRRAPAEALMPLDDLAGDRRAAEAFIALVTDLFQSAVPAVRLHQVVPGHAVEVRMRAEALFEPGADTLRPSRQSLLDSVVAALAGAPRGLRFEMAVIAEVVEARDANDVAVLPADGTHLAVRRAGTFGRFMNDRGAARGSVLVGLAPGDPDWIRLVFRSVDVTRWDPDFSAVPADAVAIDAPVGAGDDETPAPAPAARFPGAQDEDADAMMSPAGDAARGTPTIVPFGGPDAGSSPDSRPAWAPAGGVDGGGEDSGAPNENNGTVRERTAR
ncbi:hypothetical protein [Roseospira visakhapatnamensis]|uniref:Motility protein B-like N-terminal domain-containing protein n=1 Tax=Roseospira visakhapatnamensis TaxID=390880 RepID=A0A7W6RF07_9PROT|nr:hypothetical protein [Roseospira visakhapatnamensis]MBB4266728.1 hypothetical protein [Roseospira visakhapatnamensis]